MTKGPVLERQYLFIRNSIKKKERIYIQEEIFKEIIKKQYLRVEEKHEFSLRGYLSAERDDHAYPDYVS